MAIDPKLLLRIQAILTEAHNAFVANFIGPDAVAPEVLQRLREAGKYEPRARMVVDSYMVGRVQAKLGNQGQGLGRPSPATSTPPPALPTRPSLPLSTPQTPLPAGRLPYLAGKPSTGTPVPKTADGKEMGYDQVRAYLQRDPIPLSDAEQRGIALNEVRAAQYLRGLGNRVEAQTSNLLIQADAKQEANFKRIVTDEVSRNIAQRQTVQQLKSALGHATGDWARDLDRIALTEKQAALQAGMAAGIEDAYGSDARVYKQVSPSACDNCKRLYLHADGSPIVFKLSDMQAVGNNIGRKVKDWVACVDPCHPHCLCSLLMAPLGMIPTADGRLVPPSRKSLKGTRQAGSMTSMRKGRPVIIPLMARRGKASFRIR